MKIVTWNCKNFKTNVPWLTSIGMDFDILLLQETWLFDFEENLVSSLFPNCTCITASSMKNNKNSTRGRPFGGTAVIIKKEFNSAIISVKKDDPRILSIELQSDYGILLIVNVYMPCNSPQNNDLIFSYYNKLQSLIRDHSGPAVIAGDFNVSPKHNNFIELQRMCRENDMDFIDVYTLPDDTFTFCGTGNGFKSWLDHCIATDNLLDNVQLPFEITPRDHLVLSFTIKDIVPKCSSTAQISYFTPSRVKWDKMDQFEIDYYQSQVTNMLSRYDWNICTSKHCNDDEHKKTIDKLVSALIHVLQTAGKMCENGKKKQTRNHKVVNGWNDLVKDDFMEYRSAYCAWSINRNSADLFSNMCCARRKFKYSLAKCRRQEKRRLDDKLALSYTGKDFKQFWKFVKSNDKTEIQMLSKKSR